MNNTSKDALDKPGSSFLWVGRDHHLDREEVEILIKYLQNWLFTGSLGECPVCKGTGETYEPVSGWQTNMVPCPICQRKKE